MKGSRNTLSRLDKIDNLYDKDNNNNNSNEPTLDSLSESGSSSPD